MYQVYTHPKYIEHGKKFFEGVNERYTAYARLLEPKIGIPYSVITPLIFIFVRACVHYAMFEDEYYLHSQLEVLKQGVALFAKKISKTDGGKEMKRKFGGLLLALCMALLPAAVGGVRGGWGCVPPGAAGLFPRLREILL